MGACGRGTAGGFPAAGMGGAESGCGAEAGKAWCGLGCCGIGVGIGIDCGICCGGVNRWGAGGCPNDVAGFANGTDMARLLGADQQDTPILTAMRAAAHRTDGAHSSVARLITACIPRSVTRAFDALRTGAEPARPLS